MLCLPSRDCNLLLPERLPQEGVTKLIPDEDGTYGLGKVKLIIHKWPNMTYFQGLLE
jgi:hypothetical protein